MLGFLVCLLVLGTTYSGRPRSLIFDSIYFRLIEPEDVAYVYRSIPAKDFGTPLMQKYATIPLVPTDPPDGCSAFMNGDDVIGAIALVTRGGCSFLSKTIVAEEHGAVAVIIADSNTKNIGNWIDMVHDYTERGVTIPALFLLGSDGNHIKQSLLANGMKSALISIPVNVTMYPNLLLNQPPWTLL
ncbi:protease-associated domain-containing protein 1-like [Corticium candelabrum]|uniref:protease-associated domain-containing protein 1-like n=1 Tax=Corticium candelabrum TaxID=121492 RepID=UPI002E276B01|nr:protease-associated domain-containing protein 1-like [Corticium candelabrum]